MLNPLLSFVAKKGASSSWNHLVQCFKVGFGLVNGNSSRCIGHRATPRVYLIIPTPFIEKWLVEYQSHLPWWVPLVYCSKGPPEKPVDKKTDATHIRIVTLCNFKWKNDSEMPWYAMKIHEEMMEHENPIQHLMNPWTWGWTSWKSDGSLPSTQQILSCFDPSPGRNSADSSRMNADYICIYTI